MNKPWQPIETAPSGTWVDVLFNSGRKIKALKTSEEMLWQIGRVGSHPSWVSPIEDLTAPDDIRQQGGIWYTIATYGRLQPGEAQWRPLTGDKPKGYDVVEARYGRRNIQN